MVTLGIFCVLSAYFFCGQATVAESYDPIISLHSEGSEHGDIYEATRDEFKCPSSFGAFSDPDDCSQFYVCVAGIAVLRRCRTFQRFDVWRKKCLPALIAVCGDDKSKTTTATTRSGRTTTPSGDSFSCPSFSGSYPHPNDCSKYFTCTFFMSSLETCYKGQLFDAVKSKCRPENEVNCGSRQRPDKTTTATTRSSKTTTPSGDSFSCPSFSGSYPHPKDCSKYFTCTFFMSSLKTCRKGQLFDAVKSKCRPENEVNCGSRQRPGTTTPQVITETMPISTTTVTPETTTESTTITTLTTEEEPVTDTPTTTIMSTTDDFPTGPPETDCEEDDVDCIIDETGDITNWFRCPDDIGAYGHPSSGKLFIFCMNWIPSVKKCGMDMVFSEEMKTCIEIKYIL